MSRLLIHPASLPPRGDTDYGWASLTQDGTALLSHGSAPLALLPSGETVTLLVPGSALSWHSVTLPPGSLGNSTRLRSVLEGLLEDHLLDEPQALHYAVQPEAKAGAPIWVAVCDRAALRATVQAIEAQGRRVTRIVPEFTPQSDPGPAFLFATGEPQAARLTFCDASGVLSLPLDAASVNLALNTPFDTVSASAEPGVAAQAEALFGQRIPLVQRAERWLRAANGPWDLAQFDFASTGRARAGKQLAATLRALRHGPRWRAARWGAVALVLVQLAGLNAWAWKERHALEAKRGAIHNILTQTFPTVKLVVDAPKQMAREVSALEQASGSVAGADFEPMLSALGAALPDARVPSAVDFSGGQMRLRGLALSPKDIAALSRQLALRGYSARGEGDLLLIQAESAP